MTAGGEILPTLTSGVARSKEPGSARFVFVSRVSRMKTLDFAVRCLARLQGNVTFDVIGPLEDAGYWEDIQRRIRTLPRSVTVRAHGQIPHEEVGKAFQRFDFFLFPTLGE